MCYIQNRQQRYEKCFVTIVIEEAQEQPSLLLSLVISLSIFQSLVSLLCCAATAGQSLDATQVSEPQLRCGCQAVSLYRRDTTSLRYNPNLRIAPQALIVTKRGCLSLCFFLLLTSSWLTKGEVSLPKPPSFFLSSTGGCTYRNRFHMRS